MRVYTADEWGAFPQGNADRLQPATGIAIILTGSANRRPQSDEREELREAAWLAREFQWQERWRVKDAGHHFLVSRGGLTLEGRRGSLCAASRGKAVIVAACAPDEPCIAPWIVRCEGRRETVRETLPEAQWEALVALCGHLLFFALLPAERISGEIAEPDRLMREAQRAKTDLLKVAFRNAGDGAPATRTQAGGSDPYQIPVSPVEEEKEWAPVTPAPSSEGELMRASLYHSSDSEP